VEESATVKRRRRAPYTQPAYYDVAFSSNRDGEVSFLMHCFTAYAKRSVRQVVDIACGPGAHALRLAQRGYRITAFDLSPENTRYVAEKAYRQGLDITVNIDDMAKFQLSEKVDAAICLQNSQGYMLTNDDLVRHFRAVAAALRRGGLYIFDRYMVSSWTNPARSWSWSRRRGRLIVRASFSALHDVNPVTQLFRERMTLEAVENGTRRVYRQTYISRMVFPQELRALVELAGGFEFVQWFFGFKDHQILERLKHPLLMVVVLRKT